MLHTHTSVYLYLPICIVTVYSISSVSQFYSKWYDLIGENWIQFKSIDTIAHAC